MFSYMFEGFEPGRMLEIFYILRVSGIFLFHSRYVDLMELSFVCFFFENSQRFVIEMDLIRFGHQF